MTVEPTSFQDKIHPRANEFLDKLIKDEYDGKKSKIEMYSMFLQAKRKLLAMDKRFKITPLTDKEFDDDLFWGSENCPYIAPHLEHMEPLRTWLMLVRSHGYKVQFFA